MVAHGAAAALRTRPLPQPTASSLVVASFFFYSIYYITLLCGTRSLMAMESRAIAGSLSADHQLPGVPKAK